MKDRSLFDCLADQSNVDVFTTESQKVVTGAHRLEGAFYGSDGFRSVSQMERSGFDILHIGDHSDVCWFGPFARTYVESSSHGTPFMSSSEMMEAILEPSKLISNTYTKNLQRLLVSAGTILISCSGTIGNVVVCPFESDSFAMSQHAIRVVPRGLFLGPIYCMLQSRIGQFLVTRNKSGSVIESIYADDVASLRLPSFPRKLNEELTNKINESLQLRDRARKEMESATELCRKQSYLDSAIMQPKSLSTFTHNSADIMTLDRDFGSVRLDATYFEPNTIKLRARLRSKGAKPIAQLVDAITRSSLRERTYVEDRSMGVPIVTGKQMMLWRQKEVKFVSKTLTKNIEKETIQKHAILVTCDGTIGRTQFAHRNFEGWMASELVMRFHPRPEVCFPGFLFAFLRSRFGQMQIQQQIHGSVIQHIRDYEFGKILVCVPPDRGEQVHDMVVRSYDLRADAVGLEDGAIALFETAIKRGRELTEAEWGSEY